MERDNEAHRGVERERGRYVQESGVGRQKERGESSDFEIMG